MVLETISGLKCHNAIASANYEPVQHYINRIKIERVCSIVRRTTSATSAQRRIRGASERRVLTHLLMWRDEFQLTDTVTGSTAFARRIHCFGAKKRDSAAFAYPDFHRKTRLFRTLALPGSTPLHSTGLPIGGASKILTSLLDILRDRKRTLPEYAHLVLRCVRSLAIPYARRCRKLDGDGGHEVAMVCSTRRKREFVPTFKYRIPVLTIPPSRRRTVSQSRIRSWQRKIQPDARSE